MNLENIKCFITLSECLNFTRAAEIQHISQTTVSKRINSLEAELGISLLYRDTHLVELTAPGYIFYQKAKEMMRFYDDALDAVQHANDSFKKNLRIGIGAYDHVLLNRFLPYYMDHIEYPVNITLQQSPHAALVKDFEDHLVDIILCTDQYYGELKNKFGDALLEITINKEPWNIIFSKDSPLAQYDVVPFKALQDETLITLGMETYEQAIESFKSYFQFKDLCYVNSFDSKLLLANANVGFSFAPPFVFPVADRYKNLVVRKTDPPYNRHYFIMLYWKKSNEVVQEFVKLYQQYMEEENNN